MEKERREEKDWVGEGKRERSTSHDVVDGVSAGGRW
jgi:hypothetical protein